MFYRFVVIDDSDLDCYIVEKKISHVAPQSLVVSYKEATSALAMIRSEDATAGSYLRTVILLDILMPLMNGYEFMEVFEGLDHILREKFLVIAVTSSMYKTQIGKIYSFPSILGVLEKPFTITDLEKILLKTGNAGITSVN